MPWYSTKYRDPRSDGQYGGRIWAWSYDEAVHLATLRGLGECVENYSIWPDKAFRPPSENILNPMTRPSDVIHALAWVGHLALSSRVVTPHEILGDSGVLHQYTHLLVHECYKEHEVFMSRPPNKLITIAMFREELATWYSGGPPPYELVEIVKDLRRIEEKIPGFLPKSG